MCVCYITHTHVCDVSNLHGLCVCAYVCVLLTARRLFVSQGAHLEFLFPWQLGPRVGQIRELLRCRYFFFVFEGFPDGSATAAVHKEICLVSELDRKSVG